MNAEQLHIIQHSIGCDQYGQSESAGRNESDGCFGYYRNRYVSDPTPDLIALVAARLMVDRGAYDIAGGMHYYRITEAGVAAMKQQSPKPPILTRGQKRYREFLAADCSMTFGEFLKWRHANRDRIAELGYSK